MANQKFQRPRGTQDILPSEQGLWALITSEFVKDTENAGFGRISTPILESTELFTRAVGEQTEVVSKEMYSLEDKSGHSLSLKPESTAGVVRAYIENGMASLATPVKLYYIEPHFRYERPQAGRYRQHHQMGVEIFGDDSELSDAHVIKLGSRILNELGVDHKVILNSIGVSTDRLKYIEALKRYFEQHEQDLPEINQAQLKKNPLRILDSKDESVVRLINDAPQILDYLSKDSAKRFQKVLESLESCGVGYELNSRLVRGLDYYNDTVFEYVAITGEIRDSLGGGGRYDKLVSLMGGADTPAVGFGMGIERIRDFLTAKGRKAKKPSCEVFVVAIGKDSAAYAEELRERLLDTGLSVGANFTKRSIGDQLSIASKNHARYAVIVGEREAKQKEAIIKDLSSGNQHTEKNDSIITMLTSTLRP